MRDKNSENERESELVKGISKDLAKLLFIPGYMVKYLRDTERQGDNVAAAALDKNRFVRGIAYASAAGFGFCQAGLYYTMLLKPLYECLTN